MSSIWYEQVNTGLVNEILNSVKIRDVAGNKVPIPKKSVTVRKPEDEFKSEMFPCVSIYMRSSKHDPIRYSNKPLMVGHEQGSPVASFEMPPIPFILYYQIDFWSKYKTDMDLMLESWLLSHFRQFNLPVRGYNGNERTCNCMVRGAAVPSDLMAGSERTYHTTVRLDVWVELDSEMQYNDFIILNRRINVEKKGD